MGADPYEGQLDPTGRDANRRYLLAKIERLERSLERLETRVTALEAAAIPATPAPSIPGCAWIQTARGRLCGNPVEPFGPDTPLAALGLCARHKRALQKGASEATV